MGPQPAAKGLPTGVWGRRRVYWLFFVRLRNFCLFRLRNEASHTQKYVPENSAVLEILHLILFKVPLKCLWYYWPTRVHGPSAPVSSSMLLWDCVHYFRNCGVLRADMRDPALTLWCIFATWCFLHVGAYPKIMRQLVRLLFILEEGIGGLMGIQLRQMISIFGLNMC